MAADENGGVQIPIDAIDGTAAAFAAVQAGLQAVAEAVRGVEASITASMAKSGDSFKKAGDDAKGVAERIESGFAGVLGSVRGQSADLSKTLVDTFTSPVQSIEVLTTAVSDNLISAFSDLGGIANDVTTALGITLAAVVALTAGIIELGKKGTEVNDVQEGFQRMSGSAENATKILAAMRTGVAGTVNDLTLMKDASHLLATGVTANAEQFKTLTEGARTLSRDGFGSVEEVMNKVNRAMEMGTVKRLALMGLTVDAKASEVAYATAHNTTASALSATEKLEAHRMGIIDALQKKIKDSGELEKTFGERISATAVAIENWANKLYAAVAESPEVNRALESIQAAWVATFGGDGQTMIETVVGWINKFANVVTEYGPPVIKTFGDILAAIESVVDFVQSTWAAIPSVFKDLGIEAAKIGGAVYLVIGALGLLTGPAIIGGLGTLAGALSVAFSTVAAQGFGGAISKLIGPITSAVGGFQTFTGTLGTLGQAMGLTVTALGGLTIAIAATVAVVTAGYQAWKLWGEHQDRVAAQQRQTTVDAANLKRINEQLGTSYTNLDDALKANNLALAEQRGEVKMTKDETMLLAVASELAGKKVTDLGDAAKNVLAKASEIAKKPITELGEAVNIVRNSLNAAGDAINKHRDQVQKMVDSLMGESANYKITSEALDLVIKKEGLDDDAKQKIIDKMDSMLHSHQKLTAAQRVFYEENIELSKPYQANITATEHLWDQYFQAVAKNSGDSLASRIAATNAWYDNEYAKVVTAAKNDEDAWGRLPAINAIMWQKLNQNHADADAADDKLRLQADKLWEEYYQSIDKNAHLTLEAQNEAIDEWYKHEFAAIETEAKTNAVAWEKKGALDAVMWARKDKARTDDEAKQLTYTEQTSQLWEQYYALIEKDAGQTVQSQIDGVDRWFENEVSKLKKDDKEWMAHYDALYALSQAKLADIYHAHDLTYQAIKKLTQDLTVNWEKSFADTLVKTGSFKDAFTQIFDTLKQDVENIFASLLTQIIKGFMQPLMDDMAGLGQSLSKSLSNAFSGGGAGGGGGGGGGFLSSLFSHGSAGGGAQGDFMGPVEEGAGAAGGGGGLFGGGGGAMVGGGAMAIGGAMQLMSAQGMGANMLAGTETGAGIGTMIMPGIGTAIGAGVGFVVGTLKALFGSHTVQDISRDAGEKFGTTFSQATADAIKKSVDSGMTEQAAELSNLGSIITDAGGLNSGNIDRMTARLHDVFSMIQTNQMTIAQGTAVIDQNWQAFATAATDSDGRISDSLKTIIQLNDQFGTQSKQIAAWQAQQGAAALDNFTAIAASQQDALTGYDAIKQEVDTTSAAVDKLGGYTLDAIGQKVWWSVTPAMQTTFDAYNAALGKQKAAADAAKQSLDDLGVEAMAAYSAAVASGMSQAAAMQKIGPSLVALQKEYTDLGMDVTDVGLKNLMLQNTVVSGNPALVNAISGLKGEMISLDNMGLMNVNTFQSMERTGANMYATLLNKSIDATGGYDQTTGAIKDMDDAQRITLMQMQDFLHQAALEAKNLGTPLDDNTQRLIDQSKTLGLWKDTGKSAADTLTDGMTTLVQKVGQLIDKLNGVTTTAETMGTKASAAFADVTSGADDAKAAIDSVTYGASPGGITDVIAHLKAAGTAAGLFAQQFTSQMGDAKKAVDTVTAPDAAHLEVMPNQSAGSPLSPSDIAMAGSIGAGAGPTHLTVQIQSLDSNSVELAMERKFLPAMVKVLGRGRSLSDLQQVLQTL
jgi:hypothetical protein